MSCQNVYRWTILTIEEDLLYRSGGLARLVPEGQLGSGDVVGPSRYKFSAERIDEFGGGD